MYYVSLAVIIIIFIWRITAGFRKGLVQEIISLLAMVVAGVCVVLIIGAIGSYMAEEISAVVEMIVILFAVCAVYRLVHVLFTSLELIAKLPVIKGLDKLMGAAIGLIEAGVIVGVLVYFLKNWGLSVLT
ncbi:CvpA family protein [Parablautia muri]|uniref:CvpA family protein n=1 Tax=Parablautia muri TaxID=2320879 RepID=A0A9X5GR90_9FIRM|nr:CvpA family protein [Parablautia muri]NBJ91931.1 CvpA family protein [Parablautia muri]